MKQFLKRLFYFFIIAFIPLLLATVGYFTYDPFNVLKPRSNYYNLSVVTNRDFISTEMFVKNNPIYHYNAFIFGSSRTLGYAPMSWKKHLPANAVPYVFDASGESVYGIFKKLEFLQRNNIPIKYALIVLDRDLSFDNNKNHKGHLLIKHPLTSQESSFDFYMEFYKAYLNPKFFFNFYNYRFTGKYKPFMKGYIENRNVIFDSITNQIILKDEDKAILTDPKKYYKDRMGSLENMRPERTDEMRRIQKKELAFLQGIKEILAAEKTNYKVVISPIYDQTKLNKYDDSILASLFQDRYYNFSGKNKFTDNITNYYEANHFTPRAGDSLLKTIYSADTLANKQK